MMRFVLATGNPHKLKEFENILASVEDRIGPFQLLSLRDIDFHTDIRENGSTFEENAMIKATAISQLGYIAIADDSGLTVDALDGAPGIYSARYAGHHGDDKANNELLLKNMKGVTKRGAQFVCAIACATPGGEQFTVRGVCEGEILEAPRGMDGFGYDPLFYYAPLKKTFAEMTENEKNGVSHRRIATELFIEQLLKILKG